MRDVPERYIRAFLFGCIQPDRNPTTYLKGSLRCRWLRGHNYRNARRFMCRVSRRLDRKQQWKLLDYYALGKLIHYTADAFTYPHNDFFPGELRCHREYEVQLQNFFLEYLQKEPSIEILHASSVMEFVSARHRRYRLIPGNPRRDSRFALQACCCILTILSVSDKF